MLCNCTSISHEAHVSDCLWITLLRCRRFCKKSKFNKHFFWFCLFICFFVEGGIGKPESQHMRQKAKASHFLQRLSSKFTTFLILFKSRLQILLFKEVESFETCRGRHTFALTNGSQLRKERRHFKETLLKQRTDSLSEQFTQKNGAI